MVRVFGFLLSAVVASSVPQVDVDETGLLQTSKHRSVARAHRWDDFISYDEYDCTALLKSKVWCPLDYFNEMKEKMQKDKECVLTSIATLEQDIKDEQAAIAAAVASKSESEQKTQEAKDCTQRAIDAIEKVNDDMVKAAEDFETLSTGLEAEISDLATKLKIVFDLSLKSVSIFDPDLCSSDGAYLVQSGHRSGFFRQMFKKFKEVTEDVVEWFEETTCNALEEHADRVCYKRVEAERKTFKEAIDKLKQEAASLKAKLADEKIKLEKAEAEKDEATRAAELAALQNSTKHEELAQVKAEYDALVAKHEEEEQSLRNALAALHKVLTTFYEELGEDLFNTLLNAR